MTMVVTSMTSITIKPREMTPDCWGQNDHERFCGKITQPHKIAWIKVNYYSHGLIIIRDQSKMSLSENLPVKGFAAGVYSPIPLPPLPRYTLNTYMYLFTQVRREEESWIREKVKGATVYRAGSKIE
jgi:hypothetical protein